ncbi:MAG TPA: response regulator [Albitalea sp.]|jgi:CheY-like chemotaxis protein|nr:response regulator [Albitalea sp.]
MATGAKTVLLVDDDTTNLETFGEILRGEGYTVVCARNGAEALACMRATRPDIVILDYVMPQMDGATMIGALKEDLRTRDIAILMTSGLPEEVVRPRCSDYDAFLQKPLDIGQALRTLSELTRLRTSAS